jgi:hypothetical protein
VAGAASQRIWQQEEIASQVKGHLKTIDLMGFKRGQEISRHVHHPTVNSFGVSKNYSDEV